MKIKIHYNEQSNKHSIYLLRFAILTAPEHCKVIVDVIINSTLKMKLKIVHDSHCA